MKASLLIVPALFMWGACTNAKNETDGEKFTVRYKCEEGEVISFEYDNSDPEKSVAYVQLTPENPEKIKMSISRSASGARYTDGRLVWWTKGKTAFLTEENSEGKPLHDNCNEFEEVRP